MFDDSSVKLEALKDNDAIVRHIHFYCHVIGDDFRLLQVNCYFTSCQRLRCGCRDDSMTSACHRALA